MGWFSKKSGPMSLHERPPVEPDPVQNIAIDPEVYRIGLQLLELARAGKAGIFSAKFYSDKLMNWSMKDQDFKVQLFRFVDVFPMLTTPEQVHEHLIDYLTQPGVTLPPGMDLGLRAGGVAKGLMTKTISSQIKSMASKFIAGTDAKSALPRLKQLWDHDIGFSVDLLGEACVSDVEADEYRDKYLDLINNLPGEVSGWKANKQIETDHLGEIPRCNVSIKISSLSAKVDPIDTEGSIRDLMTRLDPILEAAIAKGVFINFDMEQFELKDLTIELFKRCCMKHPFHAGIAIQAYLKSGPDDARDLARWAIENKRQVSVRLIKGAYWDYETPRRWAGPARCGTKSGTPTPALRTWSISSSTRRPARKKRGASSSRSGRTTSARSRMPWPGSRGGGCRRTRSNSRCSTAWLTSSSTRPPTTRKARACASASTSPWAR